MRVWFLLIFLTVGCTFSRVTASPTAPAIATTVQSAARVTLVPTVGRLAAAITRPTSTQTLAPPRPTAQPTTTDAPTSTTAPSPQACPSLDVPPSQHRVMAQVNYETKTLQVTQEITYTNQTDAPLEALLLNVEPNRWQDAFTLQSVMFADTAAPFHALTGRRLDVVLPELLLPNCQTTLTLTFEIRVPPVIGGREAFRGYFGQTVRQINLGHWLAVVVPRQAGRWLYNESILIGEQIVLEPADWEVTFTLTNAPPNTQIAAPGSVQVLNAQAWRFEHRNGRDFAVSISPVFRVSQGLTANGVEVAVYSFPDAIVSDGAGGWLDGGAYAAQVTTESIDVYTQRFGDFPHERMVIVQGDFPDGMEFSGFAFVSTDWFVNYTGAPDGYLMLITVHEVAHQWWYDVVGSDQALHPWLDEALSTYSELVYIQARYPNLVDWWWFFRVNRLNPEGAVDSTVYEFDRIRPYINAVYLRGVLMLHDIRNTLGDEAFFGWLQAYASAQAGRVATPTDLWAAMTAEQFDATALTRTAFLRQPGVR